MQLYTGTYVNILEKDLWASFKIWKLYAYETCDQYIEFLVLTALAD